MSSSILDLSVSRGTAADTSSGSNDRTATPCHSPSTPQCGTTDRYVSTTDHDHDLTTSSDNEDTRTADDNVNKERTISSLAVSAFPTDDATGSRHQLRHRSRDLSHMYTPYPLDYQAAAAAAAARFLVPFPFPSPACTTGSGPLSSSMNFYPMSFPAATPPSEAAAQFRPESAAAAAAAALSSGRVVSRSTAEPAVKVKDDCGVTSPGPVVDPTYAERRRKNNEAARRSRDARRMKERETCLRAALLQQENVRLRAEMAVLKTEIARLHCLLYDKM